MQFTILEKYTQSSVLGPLLNVFWKQWTKSDGTDSEYCSVKVLDAASPKCNNIFILSLLTEAL